MTCLGVALLSFGSLSCCILCAQGRTAVATAVTGFGSLFITIPLASVSTFYFNYNLKALAGCLIIGYSTSGFFNSLLMLTSNWRRISKIVRRRTKHLEEKMMKTVVADTGEDGIFVMAGEGERQCYFAYDFDDLPEDVKEAAIILGYDKEHWDQGLEIEVGVDWNELSEEKKAAAFKIGYEEGDWNALTPPP
mmetsp:Transcript_17395/g.32142  ORF Transcript_17395/g.32142 Transcript_17395/m.32142 type:complete len:192 (+) Transcript_17395:1-576(+)